MGRSPRPWACRASRWSSKPRRADLDEGLRDDALPAAEREDLRRLRSGIRDLREEREVLKNPAAFFARETHRR